MDGGHRLPASQVLSALGTRSHLPNLIRVLGRSRWGLVASKGILIEQRGGGGGANSVLTVWPNPASSSVRFLLDLQGGSGAWLKVHDLRGRLVHKQFFLPGRQLATWSGTDDHGRQVAAGTYFIRLTGSELDLTRKVVFLH